MGMNDMMFLGISSDYCDVEKVEHAGSRHC